MSVESSLEPTPSGYRVLRSYGEGSHLVCDFDDLEAQRDSLRATVRTSVLPHAGLQRCFRARIDLRNLSNEAAYRGNLEKMAGVDGQFVEVFNDACQSVVDAVAKEDLTVNFADVDADTHTQYMVPPLVLADGPTVHFGKGGSGKTFIALAMAACTALGREFLGQPSQQGAVMVVDYEATPKTTKARLQRIVAGLGEPWRDDLIHYWYPRARPLPDMLPGLQHKIREENIRFLIVDSAGYACGGNPNDEDVALRYFSSLNKLDIPSLTIAHVTKQKNRDEYPLGSVFWSNSARLTWNVKVDRQEGPVMQVSLFNRKSNETQPMEPMGVHLEFRDDALLLSREGGTPAPKRASGPDRILAALEAGPFSVKQLAKAFGQPDNAIRTTLNRLKPRVDQLDRAEDGSYRWSLAGSGPK